jgi:hypothetical protein
MAVAGQRLPCSSTNSLFLEAVPSRAREKMGGDLPKLRVSEARRY